MRVDDEDNYDGHESNKKYVKRFNRSSVRIFMYVYLYECMYLCIY